MARPVWSGAITFGLVTVPVKLTPAVRRHRIRFHQINRDTGNRVRRQRVDGQSGEEVGSDQIVKGYELGDGRHVVIEPDELERLSPSASRSITIEDVVPADQIDPVFFDRPYHLVPDGETATRPYRLLVEALDRTGQVAIARFVMRGSEHLAAVRAHDGVLVASTMHRADEVADPGEITDDVDEAEVSEREVEMAITLLESLQTDFDPARYPDEHHEQVEELLRRKAEGEVIEVPDDGPATGGEVVDLMSALEASLQQREGQPPSTSTGAEDELDDMSRDELYELAQERDVPGRSSMTKAELVAALRDGSMKQAS